MLGRNPLIRFENVKVHFVEFIEQIVGKLDIRLIHFVDQQHHLLVRGKTLAQCAQANIASDIRHIAIAKTRIVKTLYGVVDVEAVFGLGSRLDMPYQ